MRKTHLFFLCLIPIFCSGCPAPVEDTPPSVVIISYRELVDVPVVTDFLMGDDEFADGTVNVPVIDAFQLGKYEVTYELWCEVRTYALDHGYTIVGPGQEGHDGYTGDTPYTHEPVTFITWRDMIVWCNAYSEMESLKPVYYTDNAMQLPLKESSNYATKVTKAGSYDNPYVDWTANGYRLPTEAEWEYAARRRADGTIESGRKASGYYGAAIGDLSTQEAPEWGPYCWYQYNCGDPPSTHDVGTASFSNSLGLFDMSGNVFEFCWDWIGPFPIQNTAENPKGADISVSSSRVMRGGSFGFPANLMMTSLRSSSEPSSGGYHIGFRVARNAE